MIFIASSFLRIDSLNFDQLQLLIPYTDVTLGEYRLGIIHQIEQVRKIIIWLDYIKNTLSYLSNRQKSFLRDAYDKYEHRKNDFERDNEFLYDLPLHVKPTESW